jgi:glycosyltransferase involved in cell wall biosynthesis
MARMRVLLVNDRRIADGWGAETYLRRLVAGLQAAGDDVEVLAGEITHHGVAKLLDVWDPAARRLVEDRARAFRADVVHHHNVLRELSPSVLGVPAAVPTVLTVHDLRLTGALDHARRDPRAVASIAKSHLDRRIARRQVDAALAVSEQIASALRSSGFRDVRVVRVPADAPTAPPTDVRRCTDVLFAGRLAPDKGVDVLVDAFGLLTDRHPAARLLVAGSGPEGPRLQRRAALLGDQVRFLGRLSPEALSETLGRVRVVAVPSVPSRRPEGSPLAVVEAAMHGRPVVASDDVGAASLVTGLRCGVTVRAGSAADLAAAISTILSDDAAAVRYSEGGAEAAARLHSVGAVTAAVRSVYAELVGARR